MKALQAELKTLSKDKENRVKKGDPIHNKWMKFGGGFYGVVAMLTLLVIEWSDIKGFGLSGFREIFNNFGIEKLIELVIDMVISSILIRFEVDVLWFNLEIV